jgi:hypothetical protein
VGPLSGSAVQATLEGPFCEEDPGRLEKRQIPRPVPEAPPVSAAKLRHYSGGAVVYHYYDHRTQQYRQQTLTQEEMIGLYISHIPEKNFKMVRYYGFLSNRKRGELLPKVYEALEMEARKIPEQPGFAALMKAFLRTDPYKCILCGNRLRFTSAQAGRHATELVAERLHNIDRKRWLLAQAAG